MEIYRISRLERDQLKAVLARVSLENDAADSAEFLNHASLLSAEIPIRIREQLNNLRNGSKSSGCLIVRGFNVGDELPSTPVDWSAKFTYPANQEYDYLSIIMSSVIGEPFGFETQQDGKIIHDIVPIKGKEHFQAGCSSLAKLSFHIEDAFHPCRPDYICFMCLRNPDNVGTSGADIRSFSVPKDVKDVLLQKRFYTLPDNAHSVDSADGEQLHSIFFGNPDRPFLRIDPDFTHAVDAVAQQAMEYLIKAIDSKLVDIPIEPGDLCFLDNYRWVHGRRSFVANFDGRDRWLKRVCITTDLSKSAAYRRQLSSRLIQASAWQH